MKKLFATFLGLAVLLSSCSILGKPSEVDYNNTVVEQINETSTAIEDSATLYNEIIPDVVTESSSIDVSKMTKSYEAASTSLLNVETLMTLESRNIEQQNSVRTELQTYQSAAQEYLDLYTQMIAYYESQSYTTDLSKVKTFDESLHTSYTTFIQANNDLVDILESFVAAD